ncbi:sugar-binding domain-containing protein [Paenibacillus tyrfis]|uniref:Sugar-binding domain-containing protein n=1 Tax=Paenibacillus tyrfis TaxID=1501230 RepID=A0A081P0H3_9BACL|nr:sugar-binding domain-containing protein [Paenibacillus tyrfis]KEQ24196.1 hypothetical protein ET33_10910 [Paenibacillus tyrfis]
MKDTVGKAAAGFVLKAMKQAERIGVSWGTTLYHVVKEFPFEEKREPQDRPACRRIGNDKTEIHSNQIAYELSKKGLIQKELHHDVMTELLFAADPIRITDSQSFGPYSAQP